MTADHFDLVEILSIRAQAQNREAVRQAFVCVRIPCARRRAFAF